MNPLLLILAVVVAIGTALIIAQTKSPNAKRTATRIEFWLYTNADVPDQERVMQLLMRGSSRLRPLDQPSAVLMSDIRVSVDMVRRERNAHAFQPERIDDYLVHDQEAVEKIHECQNMIRVRFISEEPVADTRYLKFTPYLAHAYGEISEVVAVVDLIGGAIFSWDQFSNWVSSATDLTQPVHHVRVDWTRQPEGGIARTHGQVKMGCRELVSHIAPIDQQVILEEVLLDLAKERWSDDGPSGKTLVQTPYDQFLCELSPRGTDEWLVHVTRLHSPEMD